MLHFRAFGFGVDVMRPAPGRRAGCWRLRDYVAIGLLGVAVAAGAQPSARPADPHSPAAPTAVGAASASPLDQPLRLLSLAQQTYQKVQNYTCLMVKQERIRGQLEVENVIEMRLRTSPFSVNMRWRGPRHLAGQEVSYVAGRNNGLMRVHPVGLAAIVGVQNIPPNDPRVMQHSRHTITEAGIGNLIQRMGQFWTTERSHDRLRVNVAEYEYNKRRCIRVETIRTMAINDPEANYRTVLYFDKELHLPIRVERYDWPRQGSPPGGALLESYSYLNLRFNVEMSDAVFTR